MRLGVAAMSVILPDVLHVTASAIAVAEVS